MREKIKNMYRDEKGQAIILVTFLFPVICGLIGLTVDVGYIIMKKEHMQNAVDLTALGAAHDTTVNHGQVVSSAIEIGDKNGIHRNDLTINHPYNGDKYKVGLTATKEINLLFMPVLGMPNWEITVKAVAERKQKTIIETRSQVFDYAVFSGSTSSTMTMRGNGSTINGNVHSNEQIRIMGNDHVINGNVTAVNGIQKFATTVNGNVDENAPEVPMVQVDFGAYEALATRTYHTNVHFMSMDIEGVWVVNGDCKISGGQVKGKGILLVTGNLEIAGNGIDYTTSDDMLAIYVQGNIKISGTGSTIKGSLYAPNGIIRISGSDNMFHGSLIANSIEWGGADIMINGNYDLRTPTAFTLYEDYFVLVK